MKTPCTHDSTYATSHGTRAHLSRQLARQRSSTHRPSRWHHPPPLPVSRAKELPLHRHHRTPFAWQRCEQRTDTDCTSAACTDSSTHQLQVSSVPSRTLWSRESWPPPLFGRMHSCVCEVPTVRRQATGEDAQDRSMSQRHHQRRQQPMIRRQRQRWSAGHQPASTPSAAAVRRQRHERDGGGQRQRRPQQRHGHADGVGGVSGEVTTGHSRCRGAFYTEKWHIQWKIHENKLRPSSVRNMCLSNSSS